jgi:NAD+ synthase
LSRFHQKRTNGIDPCQIASIQKNHEIPSILYRGPMLDLIPRLHSHSRVIVRDFISDRFRESGASIAVIGLSGGLDSAVAMYMATEALGSSRVTAVFLPYGKLNDTDRNFAKEAVEGAGVELREVGITSFVDSLPLETEGMAKGNVQARARMIVLYAMANRENGLVVGTSNKTELLLGYFTKYGDGAADIYPLGDLYKTQLRSLAEELGIPRSIIDRPPSAGLFEGQTDEGELHLPYPILDQILYGYQRDLSPGDIADVVDHTTTTVEEMDRSGFEPPLSTGSVENVISRVQKSRHKRWSLAVPKLDISTPGFDLRERW